MAPPVPSATMLLCDNGHWYPASAGRCPECPVALTHRHAVAAALAAAAASLQVEARLAGQSLDAASSLDRALALYHDALGRLAPPPATATPTPPPPPPATAPTTPAASNTPAVAAPSMAGVPRMPTPVELEATMSLPAPRGTPPPRTGEHVTAPTVAQVARNLTPMVVRDPRMLVGWVVGGVYQVEEMLGIGGMGAVYRAQRILRNDVVALKVLFDESDRVWQHFLAEARAGRRVEHPAFARVFDVAEADGLRFLVQEYVPGRTLQAVLRERGRLPVYAAVEVCARVAEALVAAHAAGALHKDVKPGNVILQYAPPGPWVAGGALVVRVLDLGFSVMEAHEARGHQGYIGTPLYMPPEQVAGAALDARADLYALAVVLYECVTGQVPYVEEGPLSVPAVLQRKAQGLPRPMSQLRPGVPPPLDALVLACLEPDRERRLPDVATFLHALQVMPLSDDRERAG